MQKLFKAIDDLLGTRYLEKFGYLNRVTSTMLLHMTSLASMYGIGVLVIDEIQHLLHAKNDQEEMLNFFVTLSNTVGIPTVLIGTSKARELFKGNFRQARRAQEVMEQLFGIGWTKKVKNGSSFLKRFGNCNALKHAQSSQKTLKNVL